LILVARDDGGVELFDDLKQLAMSVEGVDVEDGNYRAFDAVGRFPSPPRSPMLHGQGSSTFGRREPLVGGWMHLGHVGTRHVRLTVGACMAGGVVF
jgi:hypothetical protein